MVHNVLYDEVALKVAEFLLEIDAVQLRVKDPFTWSSGLRSPIYCDNRLSLSYPYVRSFIRRSFVERLLDEFGMPDVIAGVATGGISHGVLVADELNLPFIYIRDSAKKHGMGNQIEGRFLEGQSVVVIEDLISTGNSSLRAVESLRLKNINVLGLLAIFTYELTDSEQNFHRSNCPFHTLSNYSYLLKKAQELHVISENELNLLKKWNKNPHDWLNF